jgi:hypothetical protein
MKSTNALVAAALAGVFAAGTAVTHASPSTGAPIAAEKEKDKCDGKDGCKGKDKKEKKEKKEEEKKDDTLAISNGAEKDKEKDKCDGKEKKKEKEEKKDGEIL